MKLQIRLLLGFITVVLALGACAPQLTTSPVTPTQPAGVAPTAAPQPVAQATATTAALAATPTKAAAAPTTAAPAGVKKGGQLKLSTGSLIQFDQALSSDGPSLQAMSNIHAYLYRMQDFGDPYPDLATSWEWKDDKTLIFHLRQGAKFHDDNDVFAKGQGREVVADDVVFSMNRWVSLKGSKITSDVTDVFDSAQALDKYAVQFKLKSATGGWFDQIRGLSNLAIIPKEAVDKYGADFGKHPIGAGPFKFVEYVPDDHLSLKRNDSYWVPCNLDQLYYKIVPDTTVGLVALEAGNVDFISGVPGAEIGRISQDPRFTTFYLPTKTSRMIWFPAGVKDFQDKRFRQAVAMAIDSQKVGPTIYGAAVSEATCGDLNKGVPGYVADLCQKYFPYDPAGAKKLLADAGWTVGSDGVLHDQSGKAMESIKINTFNIANLDKVIDVVITQLKAVGLPVVAEVVEFGTWSSTYISGGKDSQTNQRRLMLWAGCGGPGGVQQCWAQSASFPTVLGYNDKEVFDLISQANVTVDRKQQDAILQKAQEKIFGEYWVINATGPIGSLQAAQKYVKDYGSVWHFDNVCTAKNNVWLDK